MKNILSILFSFLLISAVSYAELPDKKNTKTSSPGYEKQKKSSVEKSSEGEVFYRTKSHKGCFKSITVC